MEDEREKRDSSKIEDLKEYFSKRRNIWKKKVRILTKMIKNAEKYSEFETKVRDAIMLILDEKAKTLEAMITLSKKVRKVKATNLVNIKVDMDLKLKTNSEQNIMMEDKLADYLEKQELIQMQLDYLDKTYLNLKDISWASKNYIDIMKMGIE